jgi:hypothetical protein
MLQFEYRLTDRENRLSHRLNGIYLGRSWKVLLLVTACLIPSLAIFYSVEAGLSLIWFFALIAVMAGYTVIEFLKQSQPSANYRQQVFFTDTHLTHVFDQSRSEVKWEGFESIDERSIGFVFNRLSRCLLVPQRVLGNQIDDCRALFERVKNKAPKSGVAVGLYRECFIEQKRICHFEFAYLANDIQQALNSNFQILNRLPTHLPTGKTSRFGCGLVISFAILIALVLLSTFEWRNDDPVHYVIVASGWLLPILLVLVIVKSARSIASQRQGKVPPERVQLCLLSDGWAIGNPHAVTFYHWNDVTEFYESESFFGFRTINQLINLIPKRIFETEEIRQNFILEAMKLHRESAHRSKVMTTDIRETGNPYQPPAPS